MDSLGGRAKAVAGSDAGEHPPAEMLGLGASA